MINNPQDDKQEPDVDLSSAVWPVVQVFLHYYHLHGPERTEGLLAGLITIKAQLDSEGETLQ